MSDKIENIKIAEEDVEVIEEVEESQLKRFVFKAGAGIKKHGPKIVAGAAAIGLTMIGYMIGKGSDDGDYESEPDGGKSETIDVGHYSEEESEE